MCGIRPIRNVTDYRAALATIDALWVTEESSYKLDQLEVISSLVDYHEKKTYPIEFPDPIEALKFHMEQQDISLKSLDEIFGSRKRTEAILERRSPLTVNIVWKLCITYNIPAESLIKPYELVPKKKPFK